MLEPGGISSHKNFLPHEICSSKIKKFATHGQLASLSATEIRSPVAQW